MKIKFLRYSSKSNIAIIWRKAQRSGKRPGILVFGGLVEHIYETFDFVAPKVIFGGFGALAIFSVRKDTFQNAAASTVFMHLNQTFYRDSMSQVI